MTPAEILMAVQIAMVVGKGAWDFLSSISGGKIPTYDELLALNDATQAKIEAQKK
jgi:hypothetical protein